MVLQKVADLQAFFGCDKTTVYKMMKRGLPSVLVGGSRYFVKEDVEDFIKKGVIKIEILTESELAKRLKVSTVSLWEWRRNKGLPNWKVGKSVRYDWEAVRKWLDEQQEPKDTK